MASKSIISKQVMTPVFRVAFPNVFTPNDKNKYGLTMLFEKQGFTGAAWLQEIVNEVLGQAQVAHYAGQQLPPSVRTNPLKDGDVPNSENKIHFPGYYYLNASTNFQPGVVDAYVDPSTQQLKVITDQREFYPGCYARAKVHAYWYSVDGNKGVALSIGNIQKVKDGEAMGGGRPATQDFDAYDEPSTPDYSGMPQQAYVQPQQAYVQPQQAYVQPQQAYAQPQQAYAQPQQNIMDI